jgi:c-di-GMP-binding flagellar brake protein YcgR
VDFRRNVAQVGADGRRHPRIEFHCPVRIEGLNGVHKVTDISLGGVFVEFQEPIKLQVGETRQLTIKVPTEYDPIKVKAEVANARHRGVGFKFVELTGKNQEMIRFCFDTFKDTIPLR